MPAVLPLISHAPDRFEVPLQRICGRYSPPPSFVFFTTALPVMAPPGMIILPPVLTYTSPSPQLLLPVKPLPFPQGAMAPPDTAPFSAGLLGPIAAFGLFPHKADDKHSRTVYKYTRNKVVSLLTVFLSLCYVHYTNCGKTRNRLFKIQNNLCKICILLPLAICDNRRKKRYRWIFISNAALI